MDFLMYILMFILVIIVIISIAMLIYIIDVSFGKDHTSSGILISKTFVPAHTTTIMIYNAATKTPMPHFVYHSDSWNFTVSVDNERHEGNVQSDLENIEISDKVSVKYKTGRLFDSTEIYSITKL